MDDEENGQRLYQLFHSRTADTAGFPETPGEKHQNTFFFYGKMAYTTETKVRERAKVIASTPPSANIINYIAHAEAILKAKARFALTDQQASGTILEALATDIAAYYAVTYDVTAYTSNAQASLTQNLLFNAIEMNMTILSDERTLKYLGKT